MRTDRLRSSIAVIFGLVMIMPMTGWAVALPADREEVVVWESGGLHADALNIVDLVARLTGAEYTVVHAGTIRLMSVSRSGVSIQQPAPGYGYPMAFSALDLGTAFPLLNRRLVEVLAVGDVVMSERSAALRGAEVGDTVVLEGWNGAVIEFRLGAIVADEDIDWTEVVVSGAVAASLGLDRPSTVRIWDDDTARLVYLLEDLMDDALPVRISNPLHPTPSTDPTLPSVLIKERFGEFSFQPLGGDAIDIDDAWEEANIVFVEVPRLGGFKCHRRMVPYVRSALAEVEAAELGDSFDPVDFQLAGGCYNARLMRGGDKGFALSRHAWGAAFDVNPSTNQYGDTPTLDNRIGEIFRAWGFAWGAGWVKPDGMHFEWTGHPGEDANPICSALTFGRLAGTVTSWSVYARDTGSCSG